MRLLDTIKKVYRIIDDKLGEDIQVLDISKLTTIATYMIFCTCQTNNHTKSICEEIHVNLKKHKKYPLGIEGLPNTGWILMDYGDFIVHLFTKDLRDYYRLEKLWGQGKKIKLKIKSEKLKVSD